MKIKSIYILALAIEGGKKKLRTVDDMGMWKEDYESLK